MNWEGVERGEREGDEGRTSEEEWEGGVGWEEELRAGREGGGR